MANPPKSDTTARSPCGSAFFCSAPAKAPTAPTCVRWHRARDGSHRRKRKAARRKAVERAKPAGVVASGSENARAGLLARI